MQQEHLFLQPIKSYGCCKISILLVDVFQVTYHTAVYMTYKFVTKNYFIIDVKYFLNGYGVWFYLFCIVYYLFECLTECTANFFQTIFFYGASQFVNIVVGKLKYDFYMINIFIAFKFQIFYKI